MTNQSNLVSELRKYSLFSELTPEECALLAPLFTHQEFSAGSLLIKQDDISSNLFLIAAGIVEVRLPLIGPAGTTSVARFGPGECVGELALAKIARRAASASAEVDCKCMVADAVRLNELFSKQPRIGYVVFRKLSEIITDRLVATNMKLRNSESHF